MLHDTISLAFFPSGRSILLALLVLIVFYVGRALWIARHEWRHCGTDTKILYLLVAPLLTLAVDLLALTDRLFWRRRDEKRSRHSGEAGVSRAG
ncbi:hypothetical protein W911_17270 [Hyphomicrobium nitrativorans NL23]|uniref:Uncharacterized protein n=1 Tax=Hyphomicrobium nitrativorans NL23 TaxID=1029756 RepID=V5SHX3_9HYPH|nr:hypothetical protein [Hyphomicrobium nitrativorans]AHB50461.1 hypothetical protein W911_17270 [Hyphomicrobium nitrativorans NL23]